MANDIIDRIEQLFSTRGHAAYFGESVSEAEHALQAAQAAERDGAEPSQIVAALLHDIGHLLHAKGEDIADRGVDAKHEDIGANWLAKHFGPEVVEPIRLHVAAKRYLCAVDHDYLRGLSSASEQSLRLQGGAFSSGEAAAFTGNPYAARAVALRCWDDEAKVPGLPTPNFNHYRPFLEAAFSRKM